MNLPNSLVTASHGQDPHPKMHHTWFYHYHYPKKTCKKGKKDQYPENVKRERERERELVGIRLWV